MGGYLAGRLRTKWANIHTDEVYFRDTAHGFLAWAVALVVTAAFLTSAATYMVGGAAASAAGGAAIATDRPTGRSSIPTSILSIPYIPFDSARPDANGVSVRGEVGRLVAKSLRQGDLPAADKRYLAQLVAARTGLSQTDAEKRVSDVVAGAQQAADTARKAIAHALPWVFPALLIGAFRASPAATMRGGKILRCYFLVQLFLISREEAGHAVYFTFVPRRAHPLHHFDRAFQPSFVDRATLTSTSSVGSWLESCSPISRR